MTSSTQRMNLCLLAGLSLLALRAHAIDIGFDREAYAVRAGESIELVTVLSEAIPNGLEGYALKLTFPAGVATLSTADITVPPELDFDLFDPGAARRVGAGFASVAGYVELGQPAYTGTAFAVFRIRVPAGTAPGSYVLQLGKLLDPGVNFVDGLGQSVDAQLVFGSATLEVLPPRAPESITDLSISVAPQGAVIAFTGVPGERYRISASPSLQAGSWTTLQVVSAPPDGRVQLLDPAGTGAPARFYRVGAP